MIANSNKEKKYVSIVIEGKFQHHNYLGRYMSMSIGLYYSMGLYADYEGNISLIDQSGEIKTFEFTLPAISATAFSKSSTASRSTSCCSMNRQDSLET